MSKLFGVILLIVGVLLLSWSLDASESLNSEVSRIFRGVPTDQTTWFLVGGAAAGLTGLYLILHRRRRTTQG